MPENPSVSIIVCTRNRAAQLHGTLASIAALNTKVSWEAIIVDNASTDDTANVIQAAMETDPHLRYLLVRRIGLGAGRDAAWREARGSIISFTDDDCYLQPDYIDCIIQAFVEAPDAGVIGGRILLHDPNDAPVTIDESIEHRIYPPYAVVLAGALQGANISFRRESLEKAGGFDPDLGAGTAFPAEDIDAIAAVLWAGHSARYDPRPTVSHHHRRTQKDIPQLVKGYDAGRGAYWAKYILRKDTRATYFRRWISISMRYEHVHQLVRFYRELRSGASYAFTKGRYLAALSGVLLATALAVCIVARIGYYKLRHVRFRVTK